MTSNDFEKLVKLYNELSDFYFDNMPEDSTTQTDRDIINDACESIMSVLEAHATSPERVSLLP